MTASDVAVVCQRLLVAVLVLLSVEGRRDPYPHDEHEHACEDISVSTEHNPWY